MHINNKIPAYVPPPRTTEQEISFDVKDSSASSYTNNSQTLQFTIEDNNAIRQQHEERRSLWYKIHDEYGPQAARNMASTWNDIVADINKQRPNILREDFDFTMINGRLTVISDELNEKDKSWLEEKINSNTQLKEPIEIYNESVAMYYDSNKDLAGGFDRSTSSFAKHLTGVGDSLIYKDVDKQLGNGGFKYRAFLDDIATFRKYGNWMEPTYSAGYAKGPDKVLIRDPFTAAIDLAMRQLQPHIDTKV